MGEVSRGYQFGTAAHRKAEMQVIVDEFRQQAAEIVERVAWEVEGKDIFVHGERGAALEEQVMSPGWGRNIGYDGPDDVRRPRDLDPVPGYGEELSKLEVARVREDLREEREMQQRHEPGVEAVAWRERWAPRQEGRVSAAQDRIMKRLEGRAQAQQEQRHGYGR